MYLFCLGGVRSHFNQHNTLFAFCRDPVRANFKILRYFLCLFIYRSHKNLPIKALKTQRGKKFFAKALEDLKIYASCTKAYLWQKIKQ